MDLKKEISEIEAFYNIVIKFEQNQIYDNYLVENSFSIVFGR